MTATDALTSSPSSAALAEPVAVYVHTPFCPSKCGYCDFNSYAMDGAIVAETVEAIELEIRRSPWRGRPAKTIFFGGGTPTYLAANQLCRLLQAVQDAHPPLPEAEITSEANPGTVDAAKFDAMRAAGFNRISLGAQSFDGEDLLRLGRVHGSGEIGAAVQRARAAGFANVNLDLMFALPHQRLEAWRSNLERALELAPDHLSLYGLTLEPNTAFYKAHLKGALTLPEDELQTRMYDAAVELTEAAGFELYEISNFARPGMRCAHNLCYWRHEPYLGYGPGAVGCAEYETPNGPARVRSTNVKHPARYVEAVQSGRIAFEWDVLDAATVRTERLMLGLRLRDGMPTTGMELDESALERVIARGWLDRGDGWIRLSPAGRHFCSQVVLELM